MPSPLREAETSDSVSEPAAVACLALPVGSSGRRHRPRKRSKPGCHRPAQGEEWGRFRLAALALNTRRTFAAGWHFESAAHRRMGSWFESRRSRTNRRCQLCSSTRSARADRIPGRGEYAPAPTWHPASCGDDTTSAADGFRTVSNRRGPFAVSSRQL